MLSLIQYLSTLHASVLSNPFVFSAGGFDRMLYPIKTISEFFDLHDTKCENLANALKQEYGNNLITTKLPVYHYGPNSPIGPGKFPMHGLSFPSSSQLTTTMDCQDDEVVEPTTGSMVVMRIPCELNGRFKILSSTGKTASLLVEDDCKVFGSDADSNIKHGSSIPVPMFCDLDQHLDFYAMHAVRVVGCGRFTTPSIKFNIRKSDDQFLVFQRHAHLSGELESYAVWLGTLPSTPSTHNSGSLGSTLNSLNSTFSSLQTSSLQTSDSGSKNIGYAVYIEDRELAEKFHQQFKQRSR